MNTPRIVVAGCLLALAVLWAFPAAGQTRIRFSAFGDFVGGFQSGGYADTAARQSFEAFGADPDPVNTVRGFGLTGVDFIVIADMTDDFTFLGELNLQAGRGGSGDMELDVERFFMDYRIDPRLNFQAGLFFTPIGFNNRFLYARAWLMNSIQVPDFYEEELNLVPTHSIGISVYGQFELGGHHRLGYQFGAANGRATAPDGAVYARDPSNSKEYTGLFEWLIPGYKDSRIGVSGWKGGISTTYVGAIGDVVDAGEADAIELDETGIDVYVIINTRRLTVNAEYVASWQKDQIGNLAQGTYHMSGGMIEAALHTMGGRFHPFIRYDKTSLPNGGGDYLSLRADGDEFTRVYVPQFQAVLGGASYDVNLHLRVKIEYAHHIDGPRKQNSVALQAAFGF